MTLEAPGCWAFAWEGPDRAAETSSLGFESGRYRNSHRAGGEKNSCRLFGVRGKAHSLHLEQNWKMLCPKKTKGVTLRPYSVVHAVHHGVLFLL